MALLNRTDVNKPVQRQNRGALRMWFWALIGVLVVLLLIVLLQRYLTGTFG
jgi:hypothetical protein